MKKRSRILFFIFTILVLISCQANPVRTSTAPIPTSTSISLPVEITDAQGVTMRLVPAGEFIMGWDGNSSTGPAQNLSLDAFYMDVYEVTNARYADCVTAGICAPPHETGSGLRPDYYGNPPYDDFPVVYVDWSMARTYCEVWRGGHLPSEAEWEKAARGADGRTYPWGENIGCDQANYDGTPDPASYCVGETSKVGSYESGKSPYGLYDMTGNVFEWVSSLNRLYPYDATDGREDPADEGSRVIRGGAWSENEDDQQAFNRSWVEPGFSESVIGFRCARDAVP